MAPVRTCVVCRRRRDDTEMVRAGQHRDGSWYLGRGVGRGVWWCDAGDCEAGVGVAHLARALRSPVLEGDLAVVRRLAARKRL